MDYTKDGEGRIFNSDLALERRRADLQVDGIHYRKERAPIGVFEKITVTTKEGARSIGRPEGIYDTLVLPRLDRLDLGECDDAVECVARELCTIASARGIFPDKILVVGLGNRALTPDAVGALAAEEVIPTLNMKEECPEMFEALECSAIATIAPNVSSRSGVESALIVESVVKRLMPTLVVIIDAMAARSPKRLGTTIQFCDTGIHPGSGVGSHKGALSERTLGVPTIAIGVPTVIDARLLVEGEDEEECIGMLVCPKEIDGIVRAASKIIGGGINQAFGISY